MSEERMPYASVFCTTSERGNELYSVVLQDGSIMKEQKFMDAALAAGLLNNANAAGYSAGREDERDRCAEIAENEAGEIPECMTGRIIAEKIRKVDNDERG